MPYNSKENALVSISRKHHALLKKIAEEDKRGLTVTAELLIEEAASKRKIKP